MKKAIKFFILTIIPALSTMILAAIIWLNGLGRIFDLISFVLFIIAVVSIYAPGCEL